MRGSTILNRRWFFAPLKTAVAVMFAVALALLCRAAAFAADCTVNGCVFDSGGSPVNGDADVYVTLQDGPLGDVTLRSDMSVNMICGANANYYEVVFTDAQCGGGAFDVVAQGYNATNSGKDDTMQSSDGGTLEIYLYLDEPLMHVAGESVAQNGAATGATDLAMEWVSFRAESGTMSISAVRVDQSGSSTLDSDISQVRIIEDQDGGKDIDGGEPVLGSGTFASQTATITLGSPYTVTTATSSWLVVYDLSATATPGETVGATLQNNIFLTIATGSAHQENFPMVSGETEVEVLTVESVAQVNSTTVDVLFTADVNSSASAVNTANYSMDGGIGAPSLASARPDGKTIRLTFSALQECDYYQLSLSNIYSNSGYALLPGASPADVDMLMTVVDSDISGDVTWTAGPYCITDDINVPAGSKLTIEAGATVDFLAGVTAADQGWPDAADLIVSGELKVQGTSGSPVVFTSQASSPAMDDWGGIIFNSSASDTSEISGLQLSYSGYGIDVTGTSPTIQDSEFSYCGTAHQCVTLDESSSMVLTSEFTDCTGAGYACLMVTGTSEVFISMSRFTSNDIGVYLAGGAYLMGDEFDGLTSYGVAVHDGSEESLFKDDNFLNNGVGIGTWVDSHTVSAQHNYFESNTSNTATVGCSGCGVDITYQLSGRIDHEYEISQVVLKEDATYTTDLGISTPPGSTLYIQFEGSDYDAVMANSLVARVYSTVTDQWGIAVELTETGGNTGVYRGTATLDAASDQSSNTIGASVTETVVAIYFRDFSTNDSAVVTSDSTAPSDIPYVYDGPGADIDATGSTTMLAANWGASTDAESGISEYLYAMGTEPGSNSVVDWTSAGTATGVVATGLSLSHGQKYYVTVVAKNGGGLTSGFALSDGQTVDLTAPFTVSLVSDGKGGDIDWTSSTSTLNAHWVAAVDPESSVSRYWYGVGTTAGATDVVGWTDNATDTFATATGLSLSDAATYYFTVKSENELGLISSAANSDGQTVDTSGPAPVAVVYDGVETASDWVWTPWTSQIGANWATSTDAQSGLGSYWVAIGTTPGATDVMDWADNSLTNVRVQTGLSLSDGLTYYHSIKVENGAGLFSTATVSNGQTVDSSPPVMPSTVNDGPGEDIDWASDTTTVYGNWDDATDPDSGMKRYRYQIIETGTGIVVDWTYCTDSQFVETGLSLSDGKDYYINVMAENNAGGVSSPVSSDEFTVDATGPSAPAEVRDGEGTDVDYATSSTTLHANWDAATDAESGISVYGYAIGTTPGATDVVDWSGSMTTSVTESGLTLTDGVTYYFTVVARNGAGAWATATMSDGQFVDASPPSDVAWVNDGADDDVGWASQSGRLEANWAAASDTHTGIAEYWYAIGTTPGGTDVLGWTSAGAATGAVQTGLSTTDGQAYYFSVKAENGVGLMSGAVNSDGQTMDASAPDAVSSVTDGQGADLDWSTSSTTLYAGWAETSDPHSGVAAYWYSIGTSAGASDVVAWTSAGVASAATATGLSLADGQAYYTTVKTINGVGLWSSQTVSDGITVDTTGPDAPSAVYDGTGADTDYTKYLTQISANWEAASDTHSGIANYYYAVGTTAGATDVVDWTGAGAATGVTHTGLSLSEGNTYYFSVFAENNVGMFSTATLSDGQTVDTVPPVQSNWAPATGTTYATTSITVTLDTNEDGGCRWSVLDRAYDMMANDCSGGGTTSHSCAATGLDHGPEYIYIACADLALNFDTATSNVALNYTIDIMPPNQSNWSPAKGAVLNTSTPTVTFNTDDNATCRWSLFDDAYADIAVGKTCTGGGTTSHSCSVIGLTEGAESVHIACVDTLGNEDTGLTNEDINYTVDTTPPAQSDWSPANGASVATGTFDVTFTTDENATCRWELADNAYASMPGGNECGGAGTTSQTCAADGLSEGTATVYFACADPYGNEDTAISNSELDYTVDLSPPVQSNWSPPKGSTYGNTYGNFTFDTDEQATCRWSLTDDGYSSIPGGNTCSGGGGTSHSCSVTGMSEGPEMVYMSCTDTLGNADTSATNEDINIAVDDSPPVQSDWDPAKDSIIATSTPVVTFTTNENGTCKWSLSDSSYASMPYGCAGMGTSHTCTLIGLNEGSDSVHFACADYYGNSDTSVTNEDITYITDTTPPVQSGWSPVTGTLLASAVYDISLWTNENATCRWELSDNAYASMPGGNECSGAGGTFHTCSVTGMSDGAEVVYVSCVDSIGNEDNAGTNTALDYTVDTSPPSDVAWVYDGTGADISITNSGVQLSANWAASTDVESGISRYWYAIGTTAGATDTAGWADNGTATGVTRTGLALNASTTYYFTVKAENGAGAMSYPVNSDGQMTSFTDSSAPADVSWVYDGTGADVDISGSKTQLSANWSASSDAESGVAAYLYSIGTTAGASDTLSWTNNGAATSTTATGLSLSDGVTYFFSVVARNGVGIISSPVSSDGQTVDSTPPADISVVNDGAGADIDYTQATSTLQANWSASSDSESGIAVYWYAIGTATGATDVVNWTDNSTANSVTETGLTLSDGTTYYFSVMAENGAGLLSGESYSDGITVDVSAPVQAGWSPASGSDIATTAPTITFTTDENATCRWSLTDAAYSGISGGNTCTGAGTYSHSCSASGLSEGANTVSLACADTAGNEDDASSNTDLSYTVDTTPPTQSGWNPAKNDTITDKSPDLSLTTDENATCRWSLSDQGYSSMSALNTCAGSGTASHTCYVSGMSEGADTVYVACVDSLGNEQSASTNEAINYTVDTTPPAQSGHDPAGGSYLSTTSPSVTFDTDETADCRWSLNDNGYTGMPGGNTCAGSGTTSQSCSTSGLSTGAEAVYFACSDSLGNEDTSGSNTALNYTVDTSAPGAVAWVFDGGGLDIDETNSGTTLSANWASASDVESGVLRYWYAIGKTSGATDVVGWTDNGVNTAATQTGLSLTSGQAYYFSVKAENNAGLMSAAANSDGQTSIFTDTTPPSNITIVNDGAGTDVDMTTNIALLANWGSSTDDESGIASYWYSVGTTSGASGTISWTQATSQEYMRSDITLVHGQTYYTTVKALNGVGLWSNTTTSDGQTVDATPPTDVTHVNDGDGADISFASSTTTLSANWPAGSDPESGVSSYYVTIATNPDGSGQLFSEYTVSDTKETKSGLTLTEGQTYYFKVRSINGVGLTATGMVSDGVTIDITVPVQSGHSPADGAQITTTSPSLTLTTDETAYCRWSATDAAYSSISSANDCSGGGTTSHTCSVSGLSEGSNSVSVSCADEAMNAQDATSNTDLSYTVDTAAPVQSAHSPADGATTADSSPEVTLSTDENATCRWSTSDAAYSSMPSLNTCGGAGGTSHTCYVTGFTEGSNSISIACGDTAGNENDSTDNTDLTYTLDTTAPVQSGHTPAGSSYVSTSSPSVTFTTDEIATCRWSTSDNSYYTMSSGNACSGAGTTSQTCAVTGLPQGTVNIYFACTDSYSNADTAGTNTALALIVDTSPPSDISTVNDGTDADVDVVASGTTLSANWTESSDAGSGVARYWYSIGTTAGASDTVSWTSIGTATSVTKTGLSLTDGQWYYFSVKAENGAGLMSGVTSSDGAESDYTDSTPPAAPSWAYDGLSADITYTSSTSALSANWAVASDPESGISAYWYSIGTTSGASDVVSWTTAGSATSVTATGLSLSDAQTYFVSVKSVNGFSLFSTVATVTDGQTVDASGPDAVAVSDGKGSDEDVTATTTAFYANWTDSADAQSGVDGYFYAVGSSAGGTDIVGWTDNGTNKSFEETGLTLTGGQTYYASVRTYNTAGGYTDSYSDGIVIETTPPSVVTVSDGTGADIDTIYTSSEMSANWTASTDAESGVARYWYSAGTTSGASDTISWTDNGLNTTVTVTDLSLVETQTYYFTVRAENGLGVLSAAATSDGQTLAAGGDPTAPSAPPYVYDGTGADVDFSSSTARLVANWGTSSDAESGIAAYWYSVGTTSGASNTVSWTSAGAVTSAVITGLSLTDGQQYFVSVKAENGDGGFSGGAVSDGVTIDTSAPVIAGAPWDWNTFESSCGGDDWTYKSGTEAVGCVWGSVMSDPESGIATYTIAFGTTPGGEELLPRGYAGDGSTTNYTYNFATPTLQQGSTYYCSLIGTNYAGIESVATVSDGVTVDTTAPADIASVLDGAGADIDEATDTTQFSANWTASTDDISGIQGYEYAIGTSAGGTDIVSWTENATATTVIHTGLSLSVGSTYYVSVKAINGTCLESNVVSSDGVTIVESATGPAPVDIFSLTASPGDTEVQLFWENPDDVNFVGVKIIRNTGGYPADTTDGTEACDTTGEFCIDTGLTNGTQYYYAAFSYSAAMSYSDGTSDGARTTATPAPYTFSLNAGWNAVGVALENATISPGTVFSGIELYEIVEFDGASFEFLSDETTLSMEYNGPVYWMYSESGLDSVTVSGTEHSAGTLVKSVPQGWNIISPPFPATITWGSAKSILRCNSVAVDLPTAYYYAGDTFGYAALEPDSGAKLRPWRAYWIYVADDNCSIYLGKDD